LGFFGTWNPIWNPAKTPGSKVPNARSPGILGTLDLWREIGWFSISSRYIISIYGIILYSIKIKNILLYYFFIPQALPSCPANRILGYMADDEAGPRAAALDADGAGPAGGDRNGRGGKIPGIKGWSPAERTALLTEAEKRCIDEGTPESDPRWKAVSKEVAAAVGLVERKDSATRDQFKESIKVVRIASMQHSVFAANKDGEEVTCPVFGADDNLEDVDGNGDVADKFHAYGTALYAYILGLSPEEKKNMGFIAGWWDLYSLVKYRFFVWKLDNKKRLSASKIVAMDHKNKFEAERAARTAEIAGNKKKREDEVAEDRASKKALVDATKGTQATLEGLGSMIGVLVKHMTTPEQNVNHAPPPAAMEHEAVVARVDNLDGRLSGVETKVDQVLELLRAHLQPRL
jgi:hypothetical protein